MRRPTTAVFLFVFMQAAAQVASGAVAGRYVHVTLPGNSRTLSLAELQVFQGSENVALKKKTTQSNTSHGGDPARAVDGNTDGEWGKGSITHTAENMADPEWEVDLGEVVAIDKIVVWNRNGFEARLNGCQISILDGKRKAVWGTGIPQPGRGATELAIEPSAKFAWADKKIPKVAARPGGRGGSGGGSSSSFSGCTPESLRLAIEDLVATFGDAYPKGSEYLARLQRLDTDDREGLLELQREALLANPLLDFDRLLVVRRSNNNALPANWQGNTSIGKTGYDNEIAILHGLDDGELQTLYKPDGGRYVGEVDLHFDARKLLFTCITDQDTWGIFEINADGSGLRQVSPDMGPDVDNYDPVYLPNERIIFDSTSTYTGVPCVGGNDYVGNLHIMDPDGANVRRLCFEQDNDWYPVVMDNGRVMYLRWEYTDSAHYFSRVLMTMNPDGTDQKGYYGSNSYWPNSLFYARPIPGSVTRFVGIVSGHLGVKRSGPLVLFDVARGRQETDGAVQIIPGHGLPVENKTIDNLASTYSDHCLHPYPLSDKYFLTSMNRSGWKICLVDVFDNILVLKEDPSGGVLHEPLPLRPTERPPVLPDRTIPGAETATVLITDVYEGPGLEGVPRGAVKNIRLFKYEYGPRNKGGHYAMGMEAGWDVHLILGTVPVEEDGSASFTIPANTPISLQPLDAEGKALQLMRSWLVGMPGETLACNGCHEDPDLTPPYRHNLASLRRASKVKPWHGPVRGFSFEREVQPVLDKYCAGCHDGQRRDDGRSIPDMSNPRKAHEAIHPYVRRNGPEGDYHLLTPLEFHADTSELVQMLQKGHHNVQLDAEAWDRLVTWIDLNAPYHGTWTEAGAKPEVLERRLELRAMYAGVTANPEEIANPYQRVDAFVAPEPLERDVRQVSVAGWPFDENTARQKQGGGVQELELGDGVTMPLVRIPQGAFAMGSNSETPVEQPVVPVKIERPYWMGATEVTLRQYQQFDPDYENGVYDKHYKDQVNRGYYMDQPDFPVIRVSWQKAAEFCQWLSARTGKNVSLPTEAQWEWACRAGSDQPFSYGDLDTDFSPFANLADAKVIEMAVSGVNPQPIPDPSPAMDFELKDTRFNDGVLHLANVGSYRPNAWGLYDMHGNVAEWTRSDYRPYPYDDNDGRNDGSLSVKKTLRGGSWHDRPLRSTSSFRLGYPTWQRVYHAGFRIVVEDEPRIASR
jgi:formylglycine-generating enzyme required for sulfatase activity